MPIWKARITRAYRRRRALYLTTYTTPVLATLASGQSATVSIVFIADKKVWDDAHTSYPAGPLWQERSCVVTAT
jgi:hypothetical protein